MLVAKINDYITNLKDHEAKFHVLKKLYIIICTNKKRTLISTSVHAN